MSPTRSSFATTAIASLALVAGAAFAQTTNNSPNSQVMPNQGNNQQPMNNSATTGSNSGVNTLPNSGATPRDNLSNDPTNPALADRNTTGATPGAGMRNDNTGTNMAANARAARADRN